MARTTETNKVQAPTMITVLKTAIRTAHRTTMVMDRTAANLAIRAYTKTLIRSWTIFTTTMKPQMVSVTKNMTPSKKFIVPSISTQMSTTTKSHNLEPQRMG